MKKAFNLISLLIFLQNAFCQTSQDHFIKGNQYLFEQKYDSSIVYYSKAIELDSNLLYAYVHRSEAYEKLGQLKNAISDRTKCIELGGEDITLNYSARGDIFVKLKEFENAIKDYKEAIRHDKEYSKNYFDLASIYLKTGKKDEALKIYKEYNTTINPTDHLGFYLEGNLLLETGDLDGAITKYTESIKLNSEYPSSYHQRGLAKKGKKLPYKSDFQKAKELGFTSPFKWRE